MLKNQCATPGSGCPHLQMQVRVVAFLLSNLTHTVQEIQALHHNTTGTGDRMLLSPQAQAV